MRLAFAMSMPTSTTDGADRASAARRARKSRIKRCLSPPPRSRPCSRPAGARRERGRAQAREFLGRGAQLRACRSPRRAAARRTPDVRRRTRRARTPGARRAWRAARCESRTGSRPGGFSSSRDTSSSPKAVSARLRGIGVAVITRMWGRSAPRSSAPRCRTPNRCCSSTTASPRRAQVTPVLNRARGCRRRDRPIPLAMRARSVALSRSVRAHEHARGARRAAQAASRRSACWMASVSVGAMNAPCQPLPIATSSAATASTVLPAPTSPMHQALHPATGFEVDEDLLQDALLRAGEPERQLRQKARMQTAPAFQPRPAPVRCSAPGGAPGAADRRRVPRARGDRAPPPPRRRCGKVNRMQRRGAFGTIAAHFGRQDLEHAPGVVFQRAVHEIAQPLLGDAARQRVQGHDAPAVQRLLAVGFEAFEFRLAHLELATNFRHRTGEENLGSGLQRFPRPRAVPNHVESAARVFDPSMHAASTPPGTSGRNAADVRLDTRHPRNQIGQPHDMTAIEVRAWQVQQEIFDRAHVQPLQRGCTLRSHAAQEAARILESSFHDFELTGPERAAPSGRRSESAR